MPFSERLKSQVRKNAHFRCCFCRQLGVEVHHIIPEEENGPDTESNAAPLCPTCHEIYGANSKKRKLIREARDLWYEICRRKSSTDIEKLDKVIEGLKITVTKKDLYKFKKDLIGHITQYVIKDSKPLSDKHKFFRNSTTQPLSMEEVIAYLYYKDYEGRKVYSLKSSQINALCDAFTKDFLWDEGEDRDIRDEFLHRFGIEAAKRVCVSALDDVDADWDKGFTKDDLSKAIHYFKIEIILLILTFPSSSERFMTISLGENGEFIYKKISDPPLKTNQTT